MHLCGEGCICELRWPGGGKDHRVAVGIRRGEVPGVPRRVDRAVDPAAAMCPGALGKRVDLVIDGSEAQHAPGAWRDRPASRAYEQVLELPAPQVD